jgi:hypothetical protein
MKLQAVLVCILCAVISAYALSTLGDTAPLSQHWLSPAMALFLFAFFGFAALSLPIVLAMPRDRKPSHTDSMSSRLIED